jgi:hypothetical protein
VHLSTHASKIVLPTVLDVMMVSRHAPLGPIIDVEHKYFH